MKNELVTAIGAAIMGVLIAFFVTNLFIGDIEDVTVKTVESTVSTEVAEPDPEIFNYKALNPTVEVYVGDCTQYENGECIDHVTEEDIIDLETNTPTENTTQENNNGSTN